MSVNLERVSMLLGVSEKLRAYGGQYSNIVKIADDELRKINEEATKQVRDTKDQYVAPSQALVPPESSPATAPSPPREPQYVSPVGNPNDPRYRDDPNLTPPNDPAKPAPQPTDRRYNPPNQPVRPQDGRSVPTRNDMNEGRPTGPHGQPVEPRSATEPLPRPAFDERKE